MQTSMQHIKPALLDKNFKTKVVYYPEGDIYILRDDKGIEVLDRNYKVVKEFQERKFVNLVF